MPTTRARADGYAAGAAGNSPETVAVGTAPYRAELKPDVLKGFADAAAALFQASMRRHRMAAGLTFADMGRRVAMIAQSLHRMETEAGYVPRLDTAHLIASSFGKDLTTFINEGVDRSEEGR